MHGSSGGYASIVWKALAAGVLVAAATAAVGGAGGDLDSLDGPKPPAAAGGLDDLAGGGTLFRIASVQTPAKAMAEGLFWRTFEGGVAASTWPVRFVLDDKDLIAPSQIVDKATEEIRTVYPITRWAATTTPPSSGRSEEWQARPFRQSRKAA